MAIKFEDDPGESRKSGATSKAVSVAQPAEPAVQAGETATQLPFGKASKPDKKGRRR